MAAKSHNNQAARVPGSPVSGTYPLGTARQHEEHQRIHGWLKALRVDDAGQLISALNGMRSFLMRHFAHEEGASGLFLMLRDARGKERQVEALRQEHREMLERMDRLEGMIRADEAVSELTRRQVDELVALVQAHEEWENALLQEALMTDIGTGD